MAETAILSVSLKQYKQEIDALKGSLLGLEKTSDEYKKIAEEIRARQSKLNEVMSIGKKEVDSTANSMNGLKAHLRELKEEVGNLDIGSEAFKKASQEILITTNKLKELEEAQGTFSRNVGNYKNAFLSAFDEMKKGPVGIISGFENLGKHIELLKAKYGSLGGATKALASTIKNGLGNALKVIAASPAIIAFGALVGVIKLIASHMNDSEQATRKWNRAMAVFQPIINMVKSAIGFLVEKVAECADWLAERTPKAVRVVTKAFANGLRGIAKFLDGFHQMPSIIKTVMNGLVKTIGGGLSVMLKGFEKLADAVGLDGVAGALRSAQNFINNLSFDAKITSMTNKLNGWADSMERMGENLATSMEYSRGLVKEQQDLEDDMRARDKKYAESQERQAKLREAAYKATGKERLRLLEELRKETEKGHKEYMEAKGREIALQKKLMDLTPNSRADKERLAQLEKEYAQEQANAAQAEVGITRLEERTKKQIENTAKAAANARDKEAKERQRALEKAKKEHEKAVKERQQKEIAYLRNKLQLIELELKGVISGSKEELELRKKLIKTKYELQVADANRSIQKEAERVAAIQKIRKQEQWEYLKLDNEFALMRYDREINVLKMLEKAFENDPIEKMALQQKISTQEMYKLIEENASKMGLFLKNTSETAESTVKKFYDTISKYGDVSAYGIEDKLKRIPELMTKWFENGAQIPNVDTMANTILKDIFDIDVTKENVDELRKAFNDLFSQAYDGIDFQAFNAIFLGQLRNFQDMVRNYNAERLKLEKDAVNERQRLRDVEYKSGTRATLEYYQTQVDIAKRELEIINEVEKYASETDEQYAERRLKAEQKVRDALILMAESSVNGEKNANALKEDEQLRHNDEMEKLAKELQNILNGAYAKEDTLAAQQAVNKKIEAEERRHSKAMQKIDNDQAKKQKMTWQKTVDVAVQSTQSMASVLNDYASYKNNQLKEDVERGKKSEEQAREEFEDLKKFQIAATAMNMLASLVSINTSVWSDKSIPSVWAKIALSATQSAAALMSGHLAIQQIKQTEYGSDGSSSGGGSPSTVDFSAVGVNPLLDENADLNRVQNVNVVSDTTTQGDRRVYILQSDLEESSKQVQVRQNATTF